MVGYGGLGKLDFLKNFSTIQLVKSTDNGLEKIQCHKRN